MNFNWVEYFNLARELSGQKGIAINEEAKLRAAISLAYYAAFCKTRNYLRDVLGDTHIPKSYKAHTYVKDKFKSNSEKNYRRIGNKLDRLRTDRNKVDYDDIVNGISSLVVKSLQDTQDIIDTLASLRS